MMNYFEFFQSAYKNEAERRSQLSSLLPIPLGLFTVIGGAVYGMAQGLHPPLEGWETVCAVLLAMAVALGMAAAFNLVRFQFGHRYRYLPRSEEIEAFRASLETYYANQGRYGSIVDDEVTANIQGDYVNFASFNAQVNDKKTHLLYITNSFLASCALAALAASVPYTWGKINSVEPENPVTMEIEFSHEEDAPAGGNDGQGQRAAARSQAGRGQ
jgi:hypothetical protein